jgi:hypothetical protein
VDAYFVLVTNSGRISPKTSDIPKSTVGTTSTQPYQFFATFINPNNPNSPFELDVTLCNQVGSVTTFSVTGVPGFMTGSNGQIFQATRTAGGPGTVTGTYTGNGGTTSDTASQTVH